MAAEAQARVESISRGYRGYSGRYTVLCYPFLLVIGDDGMLEYIV